MQFDEVRPEHFTTLSRNPFPHILIDRALQQIAGGSADGSQFRKDVLAAAGWSHGGLTPFGKYPADACEAFNRIRKVLEVTQEPDAILAELDKGAPKV
ncbi:MULTISPECIES: hypothetical protein [Chromobacterium]|uniref:Uncharacterized protein n=1 Tax=Chromobacterium haemolyticum TaxID=394935 RepID=A0A1W0CGK8_9NEIS|nr:MULTISPECIES: hypothetical protein [Chromobacterium]OQS33838.1 hypothetical protein B0T45_19855 [Chromobacterium haemolyticum]QOZ82133.1 hypothetical protein DXT74_03075 [Chromobacterium sp. Rain0013]WON82149.1 hypothetical protein OK026_13400 [Chromobacterium haemolyticum]